MYVAGSETHSEEQIIKKSSAQEAAENAKIHDFYPELLLSDDPKIQIKSIQPRQGPITGLTSVTVRVGPLSKWEKIYQHPKVSKTAYKVSKYCINLTYCIS